MNSSAFSSIPGWSVNLVVADLRREAKKSDLRWSCHIATLRAPARILDTGYRIRLHPRLIDDASRGREFSGIRDLASGIRVGLPR